MRGVASSLTEVGLQSASDLGNFYSSPSAAPVGPKATHSPPREPTVGYEQTEGQLPNPMAISLDKYIEWDTDEVPDRSHTPSPTAVIDIPMQGEAVEETPPVRQNRCLVSEHVIEHGAVWPHEHTPVAEGNGTPQNEEAPTDDQDQPRIIAKDEVVKLFVGTEEL